MVGSKANQKAALTARDDTAQTAQQEILGRTEFAGVTAGSDSCGSSRNGSTGNQLVVCFGLALDAAQWALEWRLKGCFEQRIEQHCCISYVWVS